MKVSESAVERGTGKGRGSFQNGTDLQTHKCTVEMDSLCDVMLKMLKSSAAPVVEIDKFDGNLIDYHTFRAAFKETVESTEDDQRGRLNRVIKYTVGEPKELVSGFVLDNTGRCYDNAVAALDREYGDKVRIASAYLKELRN